MRIIILSLGLLLFVTGCVRHDPNEIAGPYVVTVPKEVIVIDAGHGGKDPGSESRKYGYEEKALTLATARLLSDYLRDKGYRTILTREGDQFVSLQDRAEKANGEKADLFVSVHYNYSPSREVEGVEVYYYEGKNKQVEARKLASQELGKTVLARVIKHTKAQSRGVKAGNYAVIRETKMPAILVEGGFLSHPEELKRIKDPKYIHFLAFGIASGIEAYLQKQ